MFIFSCCFFGFTFGEFFFFFFGGGGGGGGGLFSVGLLCGFQAGEHGGRGLCCVVVLWVFLGGWWGGGLFVIVFSVIVISEWLSCIFFFVWSYFSLFGHIFIL